MPRFFDILFAVVALVLIAPILGMITATIFVMDGGPVLFRQRRIGRNGRAFEMVKFRSLDDAGRPTPLGQILRRYSLDELPEFWNVLKGDMSVVGPRPMIETEQPKLPRTRRIRQKLRPGITGWAQINGRNALAFEETYRLDLWYARNRNPMLDLYIIVATAPCVVTGYGACALASSIRSERKTHRKAIELAR